MNLNREMLELFNRWLDCCKEEDSTMSDFFACSGKAVAAFTASIIVELSEDEERQEEYLENYLANVERLTRHMIKKLNEDVVNGQRNSNDTNTP